VIDPVGWVDYTDVRTRNRCAMDEFGARPDPVGAPAVEAVFGGSWPVSAKSGKVCQGDLGWSKPYSRLGSEAVAKVSK